MIYFEALFNISYVYMHICICVSIETQILINTSLFILKVLKNISTNKQKNIFYFHWKENFHWKEKENIDFSIENSIEKYRILKDMSRLPKAITNWA